MNEKPQAVENSSEKFAVNGIFPCDNSVICLTCNELIPQSESVDAHISRQDHCNKFEQISSSYNKINNRVKCKLCTDYITAEWKDFLIHFHEKKHFEDLAMEKRSQNSDISYVCLFNNQIIETKPGEYTCHSCGNTAIGKNQIDAHIDEKKHKELQKNRHRDDPTEPQSESICRRFVKNSVSILTSSMFNCYICNCSVSGLKNVSQHFSGANHTKNLMLKNDADGQSHCEKISADQNQSQLRKSPQNMSTKSFVRLISDNVIIESSKVDEYKCNLCLVTISGKANISQHISSRRHSQLMNRNCIEKESATLNKSSSDGTAIEKSSASLEKKKSSLQNCGSSKNTSSSCKSSKNASNSSETIDTPSYYPASQEPTEFKIPANFILKDFGVRGIFLNGDSFTCLICNKPLLIFEGIPMHICGTIHCKKFEKITTSFAEIDGQVVCKLCTNQLKMKWKDFLIHFHEKRHFENLAVNVTLKSLNLSYVTLLNNQIIEKKPGVYSCCSCNKEIIGKDLIEAHIVEKQHEKCQKIRNKRFPTAIQEENDCRKLVKNWFSILTSTDFHCYLCNCPVHGLPACYSHICNISHATKMMHNDNIDQHSVIKKVEAKRNKIRPVNKLPCDMTKESFAKLICDNSITGSMKTGKYKCNLCVCMLTGPGTIPQHVSSRRHKRLMVANDIREKTTIKSESSSSWESTENSSASWETYETSLRSYRSSENLSSNCRSYENASNSWETMSTVSSYSTSQRPSQFEIPQNLDPLISNKLLELREDEIYCVPCGIHLRDQHSLLGHTNSKNHVSKLNSYKAKKTQQHEKLPTTSKKSSIANSPVNVINDKLLELAISETKQPKIVRSTTVSNTLFEVPKNLLKLIQKHSLQHLKHEIYCPTCDVHLKNIGALVSHTKSKRHVEKLSSHKPQKKDEKSSSLMNESSLKNSPVHATSDKPKQSVAKMLEKGDLQLTLLQTQKELLISSISEHILQHSCNPMSCEFYESLIKDFLKLIDNECDQSVEQLKTSVNRLTATLVKSENVGDGNFNGTQKENVTSNSNAPKYTEKIAQNELKKQQKLTKPPAKPIRVRNFVPEYLKDNMNHIYKFNPEKLRIIKLSCQLCFPTKSNTLYCLICEKSIANTLQTFYEHICCFSGYAKSHITDLAKAEQHDKDFIDYPDQFSDLRLAKEFMQEISDKTVQCYACDKLIENDITIIYKHVKGDSHKAKKQPWKEAMEKIEQAILLQMESNWYNIQKYWCEPCNLKFSAEFNFAEHLESKKHTKRLMKMNLIKNKLVYDACTSCATLWLGSFEVYTEHCQQPLHKYLIQTGDYSRFVLPPQAKALLAKAGVEVNELINSSNKVLTVEKKKTDSLLKCLEDTVKPEFPDAKAHPSGSRVSGLCFPNSDIDVFLDCGTYNGNTNSENYQKRIMKSVESLLRANEKSWQIDEIVESSRTPIIKLHHRATELSCDISFKNGLSVENTKLIKCYIDNFPLCRKLMLFLKKWLSLCNLSGSQFITHYAICWYVIFYLQVESILPSVGSLIAKQNVSHLIDNWETGICEKFDVDQKKFTFTKLLRGFFIFYNNFDFRNSVACPLLGKTILKLDFTRLHLLPEEMAPYVNYVTENGGDGSAELFRIDSEMCIQDPYDLSHNLTKAVQKFTLFRFRQLSALSAEILNASSIKD